MPSKAQEQKNARVAPTVANGPKAAALAFRLANDERGVTAVVFGIMFSVLFFVFALALDYVSATQHRQRQQAAVDAAALAGSHYLGLPNQDTDGPEAALRFFRENMGPGSTADVEIEFDAEGGTLNAQASNSYLTRALKAILPVHLRKTELEVGARSTVIKGNRVEVAMALDNSGSMSGTKLEALKSAAKDAISIITSGADLADDVKIALVPFAASVRVGTAYQNENWIYRGPEKDLSYPLFTGDDTKTRFDVLTEMGQAWGGCVEARPAPFDTNDAPPDAGSPDTLFAPMFAPDEPDDTNATNAGYGTGDYSNNYISDYGGSCPAPAQICISWRTRSGVTTCRTYGPEPMNVSDAQKRVCKYKNAVPSTSFQGSASGPNQSCTTPAITPLSSDRTLLEARVDALVANGNTNISEGAAWAWRVLSPTAPFIEGRPFNDETNKKIMIVMTDGDNFLQWRDQHNQSVYAAFGYGSQQRLSEDTTSTAYTNGLNSKTLSVCSNAKDADITVYTIAFGTEISTTGLQLLEDCASSERHAYVASDETALINTFQDIAREISRLRVAM